MSVLRVFLFGNIQIIHDRSPAEIKVTHGVQALLAYLLLQRHRSHSREILANVFWGDNSEVRARSCLSTALWRLRRALEPAGIPPGTYLMTTSTGEVGFNSNSDYWLDVAIFEERVGRVLGRPIETLEAVMVQELEQVLPLYKAELLEGFYDEWALRERERLRLMYLNGLVSLMRYFQYHRAYEPSLAYGQQILNHDPLREEIHQEMMRLYLENGQRALAIRQYETCREVLAAELGIPPMAETQMLLAQIVSETPLYQPQVGLLPEPTHLKQALQQLHLTIQGFEEVRENLQRTVELIEQLMEPRK